MKTMWIQRPFFLITSRCFHTSRICSSTTGTLTYGLNKVEVKHLKRRIVKGQANLNSKHIYKEAFTINNKYDLAEKLIESEVYHEKGKFIALVKPFGIPRFKQDEEDKLTTMGQVLNSSGFVSSTSIEEALPLISKHYKAHELEVAFIPERYTSGIMLLSFKRRYKDWIKRSFRRSIGLKIPYQTYWTVVHGIPFPEAAGERVATQLRFVQNVGAKVPVITKSFSFEDVKRGRAQPNIVEHLVLAHHKENDVSLVEVNVLNGKNHFIRVWLSYCCSPVLGDRLFGGRVKTVMGKRVALNPNNYSSYQPPDVSLKVLEKLDLSRAHLEIIPPHVHLAKLKLETKTGNEEIVITASPPDYFNWTCNHLSLMSKVDGSEDSSTPVAISNIEDVENIEDELFTE